jgi:multimeric flavodoxin WrbA
MLSWKNWKVSNLINVLSISGSPVTGSSTDFILKKIADSILIELGKAFNMRAEFVKITDLELKPCLACGEAPSPEFCFYKDDIYKLYNSIVNCDCLLVGTPIYFDSVSAQLKTLIDRCNCFRPPDFNNVDPDHHFINLMHKKRPGAMVLVGGERGWFEGARRVIAGYFKWIDVTNEGMIQFATKDFNQTGTASEDAKIIDEASQLGRKLAGIIIENNAG